MTKREKNNKEVVSKRRSSVKMKVLANNFTWNKRKDIGIEILYSRVSTSGLAGKISEVGVERVTLPT
jgi:hypothetical protein